MKNGKATGPSAAVSEMVNTGGETGVDVVKDLVNQIAVEGVIPTEYELSTIVNCYEWENDSLERRNYRGLKLTDHILKMSERISEKLIKQQMDIDEIQFGFMLRCRTTNTIYILRQLKEKHLAEKKNF